MYRFSDILGTPLLAKDGEMGRVRDCYFEASDFRVRYLGVDCNSWLPGPQVLLDAGPITSFQSGDHTLSVNLTKDQIKSAPTLEEEAAHIIRPFETPRHRQYTTTPYWEMDILVGTLYPALGLPPNPPRAWEQRLDRNMRSQQDHWHRGEYLKSLERLKGYQIHCTDLEFGDVEDFIIDPETRAVSDLIFCSHRWLPGGRTVLIPTFLLDDIDTQNKTIVLPYTKDDILGAPDFDWTTYYRAGRDPDLVAFYADIDRGEDPIGRVI